MQHTPSLTVSLISAFLIFVVIDLPMIVVVIGVAVSDDEYGPALKRNLKRVLKDRYVESKYAYITAAINGDTEKINAVLLDGYDV